MEVFNSQQSRAIDKAAQQYLGVTGYDLMCRAGAAAFDLMMECWPQAKRIVCLCGGGNNGGDAWVVARLAMQSGLHVDCVLISSVDALKGDAALAYADAKNVNIVAPSEALFDGADVIVDGLLGTGFQGVPRPATADIIMLVNSSDAPVLALDVPSGVAADSNSDILCAIQADLTVAFITYKPVHFTGPGRAFCGDIELATLGVDRRFQQSQPHDAQLLDLDEALNFLPARRRAAHKGDFGHVLSVGGDNGFGGAVIMASIAAQRVGAGLVSMVSRPEHIGALLAHAPQVMAHGIDHAAHINALLDEKTVVAIGPGLGRAAWGQQLLQKVLMGSAMCAVIDADALNLLVGRLEKLAVFKQCVMSPHPGEAARLLGCSVAQVERDRFTAVRQLHQMSGATVVLKGQGTLIFDAFGMTICPYGNPGMASGGMGDVLSGIIAGLMAQGLSAAMAARLGVALHSVAADQEAEARGEIGMAAMDLIPRVRELLNA